MKIEDMLNKEASQLLQLSPEFVTKQLDSPVPALPEFVPKPLGPPVPILPKFVPEWQDFPKSIPPEFVPKQLAPPVPTLPKFVPEWQDFPKSIPPEFVPKPLNFPMFNDSSNKKRKITDKDKEARDKETAKNLKDIESKLNDYWQSGSMPDDEKTKLELKINEIKKACEKLLGISSENIQRSKYCWALWYFFKGDYLKVMKSLDCKSFRSIDNIFNSSIELFLLLIAAKRLPSAQDKKSEIERHNSIIIKYIFPYIEKCIFDKQVYLVNCFMLIFYRLKKINTTKAPVSYEQQFSGILKNIITKITLVNETDVFANYFDILRDILLLNQQNNDEVSRNLMRIEERVDALIKNIDINRDVFVKHPSLMIGLHYYKGVINLNLRQYTIALEALNNAEILYNQLKTHALLSLAEKVLIAPLPEDITPLKNQCKKALEETAPIMEKPRSQSSGGNARICGIHVYCKQW